MGQAGSRRLESTLIWFLTTLQKCTEPAKNILFFKFEPLYWPLWFEEVKNILLGTLRGNRLKVLGRWHFSDIDSHLHWTQEARVESNVWVFSNNINVIWTS